MAIHSDVDGYDPPWPDFASFFLARSDDEALFLVELNHAEGSRQQWTVGEWKNRVLATAEWLDGQGVRSGGVVATLAGNTADALAVAYACWVMGACCAPLNPGDDADRQVYILDDAGAGLLVHDTASAATVRSLGLSDRIQVSSVDELPDGRDGQAREHPSADADRPALRVYTSGTTGRPKGVVLTGRNLLVECDSLRSSLDWPSETRIMTVLPVHHVNGLIISSLFPWFHGISTVVCDKFRSESFWSDIAAEGATVCSVVPSLLEFLLGTPGRPPQRFRELLCGAGPLLTDTVLRFEDTFSVPVRHLYGLSETTAVVTVTPRLSPAARRHWHEAFGCPSIGPSVAHAELRIHDADDVALGPEARGEIVVRGPLVMAGYAGMADETDQAFRNGWFHTGDEGFWVDGPDGEPFFFITGRLKELIIRGGVNISPLEIDAVISRHPAIEFGLAVPFANRYYGDEIAAYVVTRSPVSDEELLAFWAQSLDYALQPKVVIQGRDVPFTATGKPKRIELAKLLAPDLAIFRDQQFRRSRARQ